MRKFKIIDDFEVDLDDPKTYKHLPQTTKELRQLMLSEIGYAYVYMNYWYEDTFSNWDSGIEQKHRVEKLIACFAENERQNRDNILWYQEQIFIFQDETENMC